MARLNAIAIAALLACGHGAQTQPQVPVDTGPVPALQQLDDVHGPATLAGNGVLSLAAGDGTVYWSQQGTVDVLGNDNGDGSITSWRPGSDPVVLAAMQDQARGVAVDATDVYFAVTNALHSGGEIRRVPKAGGAVKTIAAGLPFLDGAQLDDRYVYWPDSDGIHRLAKDGSGSAAAIGGTPSFVVGPGGVYYNDLFHDGVFALSPGGSAAQKIELNIDFRWFPGISNGVLYVAHGPPSTFIVDAVPLAGGVTKMVVNQQVSGGNYAGPAIDGDGLYWIRFQTSKAELFVSTLTPALPALAQVLDPGTLHGSNISLVALGRRLIIASSDGKTGSVVAIPKPAYTAP